MNRVVFEVDVIRMFFGFALLRFAIGLKKTRATLLSNQKLNPFTPVGKTTFFVK